MQTPDQPKISRFGQAFINYGSYHYDKTNKIIHIICIPLITATLFSLLSFIPYQTTLENIPVLNNVTIGAPEALAILAIVYYIYLSPLFGAIMALGFYGSSFLWRRQFKDYSTEELFYVVLIIQIIAWGLQFVGHGVFEKRKPALMDNFSQILNAPMFVLMQLCEMLGLVTSDLKVWHAQIKKNVYLYRQKSKRN